MDLAAYDDLKFELAAVLRGVRAHCSRARQQEPEVVRELFARLAEDRFNIAMVGRFSRGKTSLMNAILATDLLPVGVVPVTSVITLVSYGSEAKAVLHYQHTRLFLDVPIRNLAEHITERGNPGNARGISVAEVQVPAEFLRRGFTFVDTPGLGSAIRANTRTTEAFLPEADAIVLVTSHDSPLSEEEARIMAAARDAGRPLFVVLNKQDMVDAGARAEAIAHVSELAARSGSGAPLAVFSVSAKEGLAAKLAGNGAALKESGLPALEAALVDFLLTGRRGVFLRGICVRMMPLLAAPMPPEFARRLEAIHGRVTGAMGSPLPGGDPAVAPLLAGCEVCAAIAGASFDFLTRYQLALYSDRATQNDLARRGGFCRAHARQFEAVAATREAATTYAPLLLRQSEALRRIAASASPQGPAREVARLLPSGASCPVCEVARQVERSAIDSIVAAIRAGHIKPGYDRSALCLPHLSRLVAHLPPDAVRQTILRQAALLARLAEDAQRFALRHDAYRRDLLTKEDYAAVERASRVLLDHPNAQYDPAFRSTE
jgi:small GTP-binding protein